MIGLKVNGLGGKGISTHAALVMAVCERLQQAGVKPGNILVWDRNARDLQACGLTDLYRSAPHSRATAPMWPASRTSRNGVWLGVNVKMAKILTRECDDGASTCPSSRITSMAGVTFSMKNMYGVVERPNELHARRLQPRRGRPELHSGDSPRRCASPLATR